MIEFPDSPVVGDIITAENGASWIWTGTAWKLNGGTGGDGGSGFTFNQDEVPEASDVGDTWYDTANGYSFVWTDDGDSIQWVQFAPGSGGGGSGGGGSSTIQVGDAVGVIKAFSGSVIPADTLVCNGQAVPAGAEYDALRAMVGANVPDLRDRFLLGAGANALKSIGGAATHVLSLGEMPIHTHVQDAHNHLQNAHVHDSVYNTATNMAAPNGVYPGYGSSADAGWRPSQLNSFTATNIAAAGTNQNAGGGAAHNNMPPWYAVVYIIQAKATMRTVSGGGGSGGDGGSGFTFVQDTQPTATKVGDTWFNTATDAGSGRSCVAIDEGSGELVWVQFSPGSAPPVVTTPWTEFTLLNGWTRYTSIPGGYRKVGDIVYLRGYVTGPNPITSTAFANLPVGFRLPSTNGSGEWAVSGYHGSRARPTFSASSSGDIWINDGLNAGGVVYLGQISWSVTQ